MDLAAPEERPSSAVSAHYLLTTQNYRRLLGLYKYRNLIGLVLILNKKLSYCWETVRRESMPRIAEIDVEMTT